MEKSTIKVLIVDDSAFMRKVLTDLFSKENDFIVLDTARNGREAVEKVQKLKPDIITMDVEMPVMDGIKAVEEIMAKYPTPILMISSLTKQGAEATMKALSAGAIDFIAKTAGPISSIETIKNEILSKCRAVVRGNLISLKKLTLKVEKPISVSPSFKVPLSGNEKIVAIGTSTGGPRALQEIITKFPANLPCGVVVVQHMPPGFTKSLADRLNSLSEVSVKEAENNDVIKPGLVFIAPGDYHMVFVQENGKTVIKLNQNPPIGGHRPAVDPMFESIAKIYGKNTIGVILTGMGRDGANGIKYIKEQRGYTIAEDQSTAVVYGMPKAAVELGAVDKVLPLSLIADEIVRSVTN